MFQTGYITNFRSDLVWFLGLPYIALLFALGSQAWLPPVAILSVAVWIELPHHFATFLRTYGLSDDWQRFKDRLIVGPIVIVGMTMLGLRYAPLTLVLLTTMWNQQHFLMQLHGFTRIYDFKARTVIPGVARWDLYLNWVLYLNMFLTAPLFVKFWIRELYRFDVNITAEGVRTLHLVSWTATIVFLAAYIANIIWATIQGHRINPIKYVFLGSTYLVLYVVAWHTASVLVHAIANMVIHGIQYNVIVYWYIRRQVEKTGQKRGLVTHLVRPGHGLAFVGICLLYAVVYQWLSGQPLDEFGFGLVNFMSMSNYEAIPTLGVEAMTAQTGFEVVATALLALPGTLHLYFDSFIWKVRDQGIRKGL